MLENTQVCQNTGIYSWFQIVKIRILGKNRCDFQSKNANPKYSQTKMAVVPPVLDSWFWLCIQCKCTYIYIYIFSPKTPAESNNPPCPAGSGNTDDVLKSRIKKGFIQWRVCLVLGNWISGGAIAQEVQSDPRSVRLLSCRNKPYTTKPKLRAVRTWNDYPLAPAGTSVAWHRR